MLCEPLVRGALRLCPREHIFLRMPLSVARRVSTDTMNNGWLANDRLQRSITYLIEMVVTFDDFTADIARQSTTMRASHLVTLHAKVSVPRPHLRSVKERTPSSFTNANNQKSVSLMTFKCLQDLRFLQLGHLRIIASAVK